MSIELLAQNAKTDASRTYMRMQLSPKEILQENILKLVNAHSHKNL